MKHRMDCISERNQLNGNLEGNKNMFQKSLSNFLVKNKQIVLENEGNKNC